MKIRARGVLIEEKIINPYMNSNKYVGSATAILVYLYTCIYKIQYFNTDTWNYEGFIFNTNSHVLLFIYLLLIHRCLFKIILNCVFLVTDNTDFYERHYLFRPCIYLISVDFVLVQRLKQILVYI